MSDDRLQRVLAAIDEANAEDPRRTAEGVGLAQLQGQLASAWAARLVPTPSEELVIAVRAHHLRRWELARTDYPQGRAGYLRWRRANKKHQAAAAGELMWAEGFGDESIRRVGELIERRGLGEDAETQTLEDAACLVFLETQFDTTIDQLDSDHMVNVVAKTVQKMSPEAVDLAGELAYSATAGEILAAGVSLAAGDSV